MAEFPVSEVQANGGRCGPYGDRWLASGLELAAGAAAVAAAASGGGGGGALLFGIGDFLLGGPDKGGGVDGVLYGLRRAVDDVLGDVGELLPLSGLGPLRRDGGCDASDLAEVYNLALGECPGDGVDGESEDCLHLGVVEGGVVGDLGCEVVEGYDSVGDGACDVAGLLGDAVFHRLLFKF